MHPDHIGLADWLCQRWNAPLWISSTDYHVARVLTSSGDTLAGGDAAADFFVSHGLADAEALANIRGRTNYYANMVPSVPAQLRAHARRRHGRASAARAWRCISGYGHAPEHISLYCEELQCAARRRHDAAAHLHQRERASRASPRPTRCACSSTASTASRRCRPTRWACPRTASPSPASTSASSSCRTTTATAWPSCWRPAPPGRSAAPRACRSCSSARSTCTRPPSPWARPWRTCTCCGSRASCSGARARTASGASALA